MKLTKQHDKWKLFALLPFLFISMIIAIVVLLGPFADVYKLIAISFLVMLLFSSVA